MSNTSSKAQNITEHQHERSILLGFGRNTAEYLTITPKHQYPHQLNIQHDTLQHITPQPSTSTKQNTRTRY